MATLGWLLVVSSASAFPSWMGVYGSYARHSGVNPGTFTVLLNQDYPGLQADVGIKIGNGSWRLYSMTKSGTVDINTIWSFTMSTPFPFDTPIEYYFYGFDTGGGRIWDNRSGLNYALHFSGPKSLEWAGNVYHWPEDGAIGYQDQLWINAESWPIGAAHEASVVMTTNNWVSSSVYAMNRAGIKGQNDWWNFNLGSFSGGQHVEYALRFSDATNNVLWVNRNGLNYHTYINPAPGLQWLGNTYHWPLPSSLDSVQSVWLNTETWPTGAATKAILYYSVGGTLWDRQAMLFSRVAQNNDWWNFQLGTVPPGKTLYYKVMGEDGNGAKRYDPAAGYYQTKIPGYVFDGDRDGMPDDWELYWFGNTASTAAANPDNDGVSGLPFENQLEYILGLEPTHSNRPSTIAAVWTPTVPQQGSVLKISYAPAANGILPSAPAYVLTGENGWSNAVSRGPMSTNVAAQRFELQIPVSMTATQIDFTFHNFNTTIWDNNQGLDWHVPVMPAPPADADADGLLDAWEVHYFGSITLHNGSADPDADGLSNTHEQAYKTHPAANDTDNDGLKDGAEVFGSATSPVKSDTDGDLIADGPNDPDGLYGVWAGPDSNPLQARPAGVIGVCTGYQASTKIRMGQDTRARPIVAWIGHDERGIQQVFVKKAFGDPPAVVNAYGRVFEGWEGFGPSLGTRGMTAADRHITDFDMAIDTNGNPVVAWISANTGGTTSVFMKRWNGTNWIDRGGSSTSYGISGVGVIASDPSVVMLIPPNAFAGEPAVSFRAIESTISYNSVIRTVVPGSANSWMKRPSIDLGANVYPREKKLQVIPGGTYKGELVVSASYDRTIAAWRWNAGGNRWDKLLCGTQDVFAGAANVSPKLLDVEVNSVNNMPTALWSWFEVVTNQVQHHLHLKQHDGMCWNPYGINENGTHSATNGGLVRKPASAVDFGTMFRQMDGSISVLWRQGVKEVFMRRYLKENNRWTNVGHSMTNRGVNVVGWDVISLDGATGSSNSYFTALMSRVDHVHQSTPDVVQFQQDTNTNGISDVYERRYGITSNRDTDGDGFPDWWEVANGMNTNVRNDALSDQDADGLSDRDEYSAQTNPRVGEPDRDLDGLSDAAERKLGSNAEAVDSDLDGLADEEEIRLLTSVNDADSDNDQLPDGWEVEVGLDPRDSGLINVRNSGVGDADGDGYSNRQEYENQTDPSQKNRKVTVLGDTQLHVAVNITHGDPSGSASESYRVNVGVSSYTSPMGQVVTNPRNQTFTAEKVKIQHAGSSLAVPDYDYVLDISPTVPDERIALVWSPKRIAGTFDNVESSWFSQEDYLIPAKINLMLDSNRDGYIHDASNNLDENTEMNPGGFIAVSPEALEPLHIHFRRGVKTGSNPTYSITLRAPEGGTNIRLWTTPAKTEEITLPKSWNNPAQALSATYYMEGLNSGKTMLEVEVSCDNAVVARDRTVVNALRIDIAMDGNRDDVIDFDNSEDTEYLFWVNNDHDMKHYNEGIWQQDDDNPATHHDYADNYIGNSQESGEHTCERDLEDFTRLHIQVDDDTVNLSGITYWLKFENITSSNPAVNVFAAVKSTTEYLSNPAVASDQIQKQNLTPQGVGATEVQIGAQHINTGKQVSPFIIEGRSAGKGDLTFIVKKDGNEVYKKAVTVNLHDMTWFYDVYTVGVTSGDRWEVQIPATATHSQAASYSPSTDEKFLLVHGWNMTDAEKSQWAETTFKRLWWQGYQGSVALFNWPTLAEYGGFWDVVTNPHHFDNSEFRSWLSADALIGVFNTLNGRGNKLRVMAHSMGNVVTGEAIRRYTGANLHTYLACQAALSAHYYDNTIAANHPCNHQGFPHDLFFPGTPDLIGHFATGDANSNPYFADNETRVSNLQNYFNAQDWALELWEINNVRKPDNWTPYLFGYVGSEDHYQEGTDRFYRGPIDNPTEILSVNNQRQRFMIWAYDAESRSRALGQTENGEFNDWNLELAPATGGMGYDQQHYSHSREFRSSIADEWNFWLRVFGTCQFKSP